MCQTVFQAPGILWSMRSAMFLDSGQSNLVGGNLEAKSSASRAHGSGHQVASLTGDRLYHCCQAHSRAPPIPHPVSEFLGFCGWWDLLRRALIQGWGNRLRVRSQGSVWGPKFSPTLRRNCIHFVVKPSLCRLCFLKTFSSWLRPPQYERESCPDPHPLWGRRETTPNLVGGR